MLQVGNSIIINNDDIRERRAAGRSDKVILTCGLKLNSTVTASSISDCGFTFCLQRTLITLSRRAVPPQEFNVRQSGGRSLFELLSIVTAMLLCDVDTKDIEQIVF